jgi:16S rRNA (uracil1498-N3)-methyltransferase
MAQKATEMGVSRLAPVMTRFTIAARVNLDRLHANAVEAAEQCGLLAIPEIAAAEPLALVLERLEPSRVLVFCDEEASKDAAPLPRPRRKRRCRQSRRGARGG